jgi:hypothetical protein
MGWEVFIEESQGRDAMNRLPTKLFDRQAKVLIPASLCTELTEEEILAVEAVWGPIRADAINRLVQSGFHEDQMPQHWHWNWALKVPKLRLLTYEGVGVECEGQMQGLMLLATANYAARLAGELGQRIVYVDYVESAPWNIRPLAEQPRYGGVGARLMAAAGRVSLAKGFAGRVGLHSLPQAEAFYETTCGMTRVGIDAEYEELAYFEWNTEQAAAFLTKEEQL